MRLGSHDPFRDVASWDAATTQNWVAALERRAAGRDQIGLRAELLRLAALRPGDTAVEIGCGTGPLLAELARAVGPDGRAVGVEPQPALAQAARDRLARDGLAANTEVYDASADRMPLPDGCAAACVAQTVLIHLPDPTLPAAISEMARVTRPGGRVAIQDQDFGTTALAHPDRALTARILDGVVSHIYEEPHSGRRLPALLHAAGLERIRLRTEVYQETTLTPYTQNFLGRRAENAVRFGLIDADAAQGWLDGVTAMAEAGTFVFTVNYYGAVGVKPRSGRRA